MTIIISVFVTGREIMECQLVSEHCFMSQPKFHSATKQHIILFTIMRSKSNHSARCLSVPYWSTQITDQVHSLWHLRLVYLHELCPYCAVQMHVQTALIIFIITGLIFISSLCWFVCLKQSIISSHVIKDYCTVQIWNIPMFELWTVL